MCTANDRIGINYDANHRLRDVEVTCSVQEGPRGHYHEPDKSSPDLPNLFKIDFNNSLSSSTRSLKWSFHFRFKPIFSDICHLPYVPHALTSLIIMSAALMQFLLPPASPPFYVHTFSSVPSPNILNLYTSPYANVL